MLLRAARARSGRPPRALLDLGRVLLCLALSTLSKESDLALLDLSSSTDVQRLGAASRELSPGVSARKRAPRASARRGAGGGGGACESKEASWRATALPGPPAPPRRSSVSYLAVHVVHSSGCQTSLAGSTTRCDVVRVVLVGRARATRERLRLSLQDLVLLPGLPFRSRTLQSAKRRRVLLL